MAYHAHLQPVAFVVANDDSLLNREARRLIHIMSERKRV